MYNNFNGFFHFLTRQLGLDLPEDVSPDRPRKSKSSLQALVQASLVHWPERDLLLGLVQPRPGDVAREGDEAVVFFVSKEPGFSSKKGPEQKARVAMTRHEFAATTVIEEQVWDDNYRSRVYEDVVKNILAYCEDQLINGDGSKVTGLLELNNATPIKKDKDESREDFYCRALNEYANITGRKPTHIILSNREQLKWHAEKGMAYAAREFPQQLIEVPIMALDLVPEDRGLILAVDDIILASSLVEWEFGFKNYQSSAKGQSRIIVSFEMGLIIKRPEAIVQLVLEGRKG